MATCAPPFCASSKLPSKQIIAEPVGRNTAPAIGLAAFLLLRNDPDAVLGLFPSDHVIATSRNFRRHSAERHRDRRGGRKHRCARHPPTRAETGYGYIEVGDQSQKGVATRCGASPKNLMLEIARAVCRRGKFLLEQRNVSLARAHARQRAARASAEYRAAAGKNCRQLRHVATSRRPLRKLYPKCENISIDYAVLEPRSKKGEGASGIFCIPADFGWNDLGSWTALYEHRSATGTGEEQHHQRRAEFTLNAKGNFVHALGKFVAVVGVENLVVVETDDALLVRPRETSQDVGKVVKHLDEKKLKRLV